MPGQLFDQLSSRFKSDPGPYQPLDAKRKEIRVLVLHPGMGPDYVHCELRRTSLTKRRRVAYETISYVWGDPTARSRVVLNGCEKDVPASSEAVLRRMRHVDRKRMVWIDAVCINQDDVLERNQQVALMADVYSAGDINLIWLGNLDGVSDLADVLRALLDDIRVGTDGFRKLLDYNTAVAGYVTHHVDVSPVLSLLTSSWFTRLWVAQEASLAPPSTCFYNEAEVPLIDVLRAARWLFHTIWRYTGMNRTIPLEYWDPLRHANLLWRYVESAYSRHVPNPHYKMHLSYLMGDMQGLKAYDRRDYVFAVSGFLRRYEDHSRPTDFPPADYNTPAGLVYAAAARYCIVESQSLDHLRSLTRRPRLLAGPEDIPSWVPIWYSDHCRLRMANGTTR